MQQFNIDISQPRGPLVLYVSQGDSLSRFFSVTVTDNGAAYTPPDGAIYTVRFGAPGMPAGWYDTITEEGGGTHPAVVVDGNTYTVELAEQAVSVPGTNAVVLIVSDATGYALATWAFELQVAAVPGYDAPEATVYYNALSEQVAQTLANAQAAAASASESAASATLAESWAVGGTGTRPGEDTNNAEYWASEAQRVSQGALGWYETEQALQAAHPTGENGQWAIIGSTDTIWTWDSDTSAWVNSGAQVDLSNYYTKAQSDARYATAAQGALAASAVQSVNGLPGPNPNLTAASVGAATAAQGAKADTAVQTVNGRSGPAVTLVPELLWTNQAKDSPFNAQTLTLDTKEYTWFIIIYSADNGYRSIVAQLGVRQQLNSSTYYNFIRPFTIRAGQVVFESCQYYGTYGSSTLTTYESGCIPWKIIGLM